MRDASRSRIARLFARLATKRMMARAVDGANQGRRARSMARLRCAVALARPLRRAPPSTVPKGLREKCPAAALRSSSNRTSIRPSSRALHLSTFRANAAPSGFCISLLSIAPRQCGSHLDRGAQTAGIRLARAGEVERGAVVDGGADQRQPERDIDAAPEACVFEHRQSLIMIHR